MEEAVLVLDNGGGTLKLGFASSDHQPNVFPNACAKVKGERHSLLADQISRHNDLSQLSLRRPTDRGYVIDWELERRIWDRSFSAVHANVSGMGLVVTEPLFNPPSLQNQMDQVIFEEFQFASCYPASSAELVLQCWLSQAPRGPCAQALTGLIIDCGFSFSHVVPICDGQVLLSGVRRINLGGKALTNFMKELVSFRSINMMEEQHLMEHVKEQTVFAAQDLLEDLSKAKAGEYRLDFVLPDGITSGTGFVQEPFARGTSKPKPDQEVPTLHLNNERFLVPELLFSPSNVGLNQAGLAEAVLQSVQSCHPDLQPLLFGNILCCGGIFKCPGFISRLSSDLRALVPSMFEVKMETVSDPSFSAWYGGCKLAMSTMYPKLAYSKLQYEEEGSSYMRSRHN